EVTLGPVTLKDVIARTRSWDPAVRAQAFSFLHRGHTREPQVIKAAFRAAKGETDHGAAQELYTLLQNLSRNNAIEEIGGDALEQAFVEISHVDREIWRHSHYMLGEVRSKRGPLASKSIQL